MIAKHTPPPWRYSPWHIEEGPSAVYDAANDLVCTTSSDETARLIAAAPDLLETVQEARALIAGDAVGVEWKRACRALIKSADAALAKATGEDA